MRNWVKNKEFYWCCQVLVDEIDEHPSLNINSIPRIHTACKLEIAFLDLSLLHNSLRPVKLSFIIIDLMLKQKEEWEKSCYCEEHNNFQDRKSVV